MIFDFCSYSTVFFIDYMKFSIHAYYRGKPSWTRWDWEFTKDITLLKLTERYQRWISC